MPDFCCVSLLAGLPNRLLSACQPQYSCMLTSTLSRSHVIICEIQITAHSVLRFILKVLSFTAKHFVNQQTEPRRVGGSSSSLSRRERKRLPQSPEGALWLEAGLLIAEWRPLLFFLLLLLLPPPPPLFLPPASSWPAVGQGDPGEQGCVWKIRRSAWSSMTAALFLSLSPSLFSHSLSPF